MKNKLIGKTLQVMELIGGSPEPVPIKNISAALGLSAGTLSRIISDLCEFGLIEKFGYHRVRPALGMIRFGQDAMTNFSLPRIVPPLIRAHAEAVEADGAFAGVHHLKLVYLYNSGTGRDASERGGLGLPYWEPILRSRLAAVVMGAELDDDRLIEVVKTNFSAPSGGADKNEVDSFLRNCLTSKKNGYLTHREFARGWSVNFPVKCGNGFYGVALYGQDAEHCNLERMIFECSLLASRLTSALDEKPS